MYEAKPCQQGWQVLDGVYEAKLRQLRSNCVAVCCAYQAYAMLAGQLLS